MWIGTRDAAEFREAYEFCEGTVGQLAYRPTPELAIGRPACGVRWIVRTRSDRSPSTLWQQLESTYSAARKLELRGVLSDGDRTPTAESVEICPWWQWNQRFPHWLGPSTATSAEPIQSVAVVTTDACVADSLLQMAVEQGVTAVWCPRPEPVRVRGVDAVWWDDSVASPASGSRWRQRIESCGPEARSARHFWLTSSRSLADWQQARRGGIRAIFGKPFESAALIATLGRDDSNPHFDLDLESRSARRMPPLAA
jgi:hypothetical protein